MKQRKDIVAAQGPKARAQQQRSPAQPKVTTSHVKPIPVAPPVFRPQPLPLVLQRKVAGPLAKQPPAGIKTGPPAGPSAYKPNQAPRVLQPKIAQRKWQHNIQGTPSIVQLASEVKWSFTRVRRLVADNKPVKDEGRDVYINRLKALAVGIDAVNREKLETEAGKAYDLANPKPQEKKKKDVSGPHEGWVVDTERTVFKNYDFSSGGGSHRPKGMVWIENDGSGDAAWTVDKDEHAGAGYKKFVKVSNQWKYAGSYTMDLVSKGR